MEGASLFLASASPRRRQLLAEAGIAFELFVVPADEDGLTEAYRGPLDELGEHLAEAKAVVARDELRRLGKHGLILASDTTVLLDGASLPKPRDRAEARRMLETLRGRVHTVATGVALGSTDSDAVRRASSRTRVLMRDYSDAEVEAYVATGDPLDKAGSYSIQHPDFHPVATITGCHLGVIGLPVCIVAALVGRGALPPVDGATDCCAWSPACTRPFPTPSAVHRDRVGGEPA
jgi:MAF protein